MRRLLVFVPLALMLVFAGCQLSVTVTEGTLVISLSEMVSAKTIQPALDMAPATYDVEGAGPEGETFSQTGLTTTTVVQASLVPGEWTITVTARNAGSDAIGEGSVVVLVEAGQVVTANVSVTPIVGDGTLDVAVTWPGGVLTTPSVNATLAPTPGSPAPISFVPGVNSAAYLNDHSNGYYVLALQLWDEGDVLWGTVEAVRIIADETSSTLFALTTDVDRGGLELEVETNLDNPIEVTLSGSVSLPRYTTMIVTATTSEAVTDYQWYLQGAPIGTNADSVEVGTGLGLGHYWLSLVVSNGTVVSSGSMEFDVVEAAPPVPIGLAVGNPSGSALDIAWDASPTATGYELYSDTASGGPFTTLVYDGAGTSATDTGLSPSTTYYYKVLAKNSIGSSSQSAPVAGTTTSEVISTFGATLDHHVESFNPNSAFPTTVYSLRVEYFDPNDQAYSLVRFDLSGLAGATASAAALELNVTSLWPGPAPLAVRLTGC